MGSCEPVRVDRIAVSCVQKTPGGTRLCFTDADMPGPLNRLGVARLVDKRCSSQPRHPNASRAADTQAHRGYSTHERGQSVCLSRQCRTESHDGSGHQGSDCARVRRQQGTGQGLRDGLGPRGVNVTITARTQSDLEATAEEIRRDAPDVTVTAVAGDITTPEGRAAALAACPHPDILINNAGGPPPGDFRDWSREDWIRALEANMLTPIELIKATVDGMMERGFGRIVNITSSAVKAPIDILGLSNGARSGLTGFVAGLARKTVRRGVTINNLLPGSFDTDRLRSNAAVQAKQNNRAVEEQLQKMAEATPAGRLGTAAEFGAACAFLCSAHAGYITGQNWLLDGGAYPGTF